MDKAEIQKIKIEITKMFEEGEKELRVLFTIKQLNKGQKHALFLLKLIILDESNSINQVTKLYDKKSDDVKNSII